jgi:hypothetical protein
MTQALIPPLNILLSDRYTLSESKSSIITYYVNQPAYSLLQPSDWLVVRQSENGTLVPAEWNTWRQTIRDEAAAKTDAINACETKENLSTYCESESFFTWAPQPTTPTN